MIRPPRFRQASRLRPQQANCDIKQCPPALRGATGTLSAGSNREVLDAEVSSPGRSCLRFSLWNSWRVSKTIQRRNSGWSILDGCPRSPRSQRAASQPLPMATNLSVTICFAALSSLPLKDQGWTPRKLELWKTRSGHSSGLAGSTEFQALRSDADAAHSPDGGIGDTVAALRQMWRAYEASRRSSQRWHPPGSTDIPLR